MIPRCFRDGSFGKMCAHIGCRANRSAPFERRVEGKPWNAAKILALTVVLALMAAGTPPTSGAWARSDDLGAEVAFDCDTISEIPPIECEALAALYDSTNGTTWGDGAGWLQDDSPCGWWGVTCAEGRVTELRLPGNLLDGPLPVQIGDLAALQVLDMRYNHLTGTLPVELGQLTALTVLNLFDNEIHGSIPSALGGLANLQTLSLEDNILTGPIPSRLGDLATLSYLSLSNNSLSGAIPPALGHLTSAEYLDLSENKLTDAIPPQLGGLASVRYLYLNNNHLNGTVPAEMGSLSALGASAPAGGGGMLDLSSNQLYGPIPASLAALTATAGIELSGNQLFGAVPPELASLAPNTWCSLGFNRLSAGDPSTIAALDPNWESSQTVPPTGLEATTAWGGVTVSWTPIPYTGDGGYYEVYYGPAAGGYYTLAGKTDDKAASDYGISGLTAGQTYAFRVRSYTPQHAYTLTLATGNDYYQQSNLWSDYSEVVTVTVQAPDNDVDCGPAPTPAAPYSGTPPDSATVRRQVSNCLDDAFVTVGKTTELNNGGAYIRMGGRPGSQVRYVRYVDGLLFRDMQIPQGAPIVYATLRLNTWWQSGEPIVAEIAGELTDQAGDFRLANTWPQLREKTSITTTWTLSGTAPAVVDAPDLAGIVQEIVDQEDWKPGNDLALLIDSIETGEQYIDWQAYDFEPANAAELIVRYGEPETPTPTPSPTPTVTPTATATPEGAAAHTWLPISVR